MSAIALPGTGPSLVYPPCPAPRLTSPVKDPISVCVHYTEYRFDLVISIKKTLEKLISDRRHS